MNFSRFNTDTFVDGVESAQFANSQFDEIVTTNQNIVIIETFLLDSEVPEAVRDALKLAVNELNRKRQDHEENFELGVSEAASYFRGQNASS